MAKQYRIGLKLLRCDAVVTAVCDIDEARAVEFSEMLGGAAVFTDYTDMADSVDAVICVLPHDLHFECGMFFASRGVHILMEKPLCNTENECVRLINTAERNGVVLMCAYPVPYWDDITALKAAVDSGEYGRIMQMSIWTEQLTMPAEGRWLNDSRRLGGGQFFSHGCHYVDLVLRFMCSPPVSGIHFGSHLGTPWMDGEGTSNMLMRFEDGAVAYHFGTWGARGTRIGYLFRVDCTDGTLVLEHGKGRVTLYTDESDISPTVLFEKPSFGKYTQHELRHFIDCIHSGTPPLTDGRSALRSLRCVWKMYEAEKQGIFADLRGL